ncbi:MAG TPA: penicillin-binding protein 2 [Bacillota bacterium]|nr:penicillin-binding protein 2 [Bacillota bacterium]
MEQKSKFLAGLVIVIFVALGIRLWYLQIMEGATSVVKSRANQTRTIKITAPRGIFYDRRERIMVSNRQACNVSVVPDDIVKRPDVLDTLSKILKMPRTELDAKLAPDPKHPRVPYQYVPISVDIDPATMNKLEEATLDLPGVEVDRVPIRSYPYGELASHLFGYIREISEEELSKMKDQGYQMGDLVGKAGLEKVYEKELRGVDGGKILEKDIYERAIPIGNKEPIPGNNIHLTIDLDLQQTAEKALEDQLAYLQKYTKWKNAKAGAVIALDPRNGNILAMVSKPSFDPNIFTGRISAEMAQKLYNNPLRPLTVNRVIQSWNPIGSTFKPITVTSALMENKVGTDLKEEFYCGGTKVVTGREFHCWISTATNTDVHRHGSQTIVEGLMNSCNIVMAELGLRVGPDNIAKWARYFGLGKPTGINLPGELSGLVPDTEWKRKTRKDIWRPFDTITYSIGQGDLIVTPLQLAQLYAAIANNGKQYKPRLVTQITTPEGVVKWQSQPQLAEELHIPSKVMDILHEGLKKVISEGTAMTAFDGFPLDKYPVAGKTGSAQKPPQDTYGVFAGYAPADNPEIVVIVQVDQGGSGSGAGAPIARKVLETYFGLNAKPVQTSSQTPLPTNSAQAGGNQGTGSQGNNANNVNNVKTTKPTEIPAQPVPDGQNTEADLPKPSNLPNP